MPGLDKADERQMSRCVGLFGTCGGSQWREPFKAELDKMGVDWYDPQKDDWKPEDAKNEALHLARDGVVLFPVTAESYGVASLAEVGFSIMQSLQRGSVTIVFIDRELDERLKAENPLAAKLSINARAIISEHLAQMSNPLVRVAQSLEEVLSMAKEEAARLKEPRLTRKSPLAQGPKLHPKRLGGGSGGGR